ncbi:MAG: hypothetical protein H6R12_648 [Proteobacteria bacterium]|nr:hypothetical protein [Pseudomonadota bacterium]
MNIALKILFAFGLATGALLAQAAPFKPYPGAQIDEYTTEAVNRRAASKTGEDAGKTTIYVTTDAYEKVVAFYRRSGREFVMPGGLGQPSDLPEGKKLRQMYLILDGASGLRTSRSWLKIQSPYVGPTWKTDLKPGDAPIRELTAIMHVQAK